jgi:glycine/D-amino acid oxidase-like deaminating enzyme
VVTVVGAGIAGLTVARLLTWAGVRVVVVSDGQPAASQVPVALVNPVRGQRAVVLPQACEALQAARSFYGSFTQLHYGIHRPLSSQQQEEWKHRLAGLALEHHWVAQGLYLPTGFWLQTRPLLAALTEGLEVVTGRVIAGDSQKVYLQDGRSIAATGLVWAGGAAGAALSGLGGRFTAGSVVQMQQWAEQARSSGGYVAGHTVGSTYLPHSHGYQPHQPQPDELAQLVDQGERLLGYRPTVLSAWAGVRYRTGEPYLRQLAPRVWALTGWGSGGYFYAPLVAAQLVEQIIRN